MIKFRCPHCNQKLGVPDEYANRRIRCSKCNQPSRVSAIDNATAAPTVPTSPPRTAAASATHKKMDAEAFFAQDKKDSVNIQFQASADVTREVDELDELELIEEDPNREAIRQAREIQLQQRRQARTATQKTRTTDRRKPKNDSDSGGGFSISTLVDFVPDFLRLPLGLVAAVAASGLMIGIWMVASRSTASALGFMALLVPLAGAAGLRLFVVNPGLGWGLLGTLIGVIGIFAGKAAIAKQFMIPYYHEQANEEVLVDLKSLLADEKYQLPPGESVKRYAQDGDFMTCVAMISLVDDNLADPKEARKWALHILLASNKTNVFAFLSSVIGSGPETPPLPEMEAENEVMFALAYERLGEWADEELELRKARQYFPALNCLCVQANTQRMLEKPPGELFKIAILDSIGLFDVLWLLLGMGLAYSILAMD